MNVEDLMSRNVVTLETVHTAQQARQLLREHKVSALPVLGDDGRPRGVISATDLAQDLEADASVGDVMSAGAFAIGGTEPAAKAALVMMQERIHHLIVLEDGKIVGIVSAFDLLKLVPQES